MKPERPPSKSRNDSFAWRKAPKRRDGDDLPGAKENRYPSPIEAAADLTRNPFALFTEWDSEADHKAYDSFRRSGGKRLAGSMKDPSR